MKRFELYFKLLTIVRVAVSEKTEAHIKYFSSLKAKIEKKGN